MHSRNPGAVVHLEVVAKKSLFYQGVDEYTVVVLVGLSDEFQELEKVIAAKVTGGFK